MAGNSQRRGAVRKSGSKKGMVVGSGGQRRRGLEGKGPTPKAADRPNHKAYKDAQRSGGTSGGGSRSGGSRRGKPSSEMIAGRNPVVECLRAGVPATALYVALGADNDERLTESVQIAADKGISILEVPRHDLDRIAANIARLDRE